MHRILVVEDSPTQARQLAFILEDAGFEVETAPDAEEGFARLPTGRFDGAFTYDAGLGVDIGARVRVPLGNRSVDGWVVGPAAADGVAIDAVKPISGIDADAASLDPAVIVVGIIVSEVTELLHGLDAVPNVPFEEYQPLIPVEGESRKNQLLNASSCT